LRSSPSSSGWSAVGGQCRNPYALDRTPSGSSSGSAAATAASLCAAALGSETDGSIVSPASCHALVGVKPTVGLVSRAGVIPISPSQDTVGPLARTVTDAALLLAALAGADPLDPITASQPPARVDYARALDRKALAGARLGVPRTGFFGVSRAMDDLCERALGELRAAGAVLVDPIDLPLPPELGAAELEVLQTEIKAALAAYLATRGADTHVRTLADVIAFDRAHARDEMLRFGQELFEAADKRGDLSSKSYTDARALCLRVARTEGIDRAMDAHQLDAIVAGTNGPPWLVDPLIGDAGSPSCSTLPAVAGYPHVTVPMGTYVGLPLGLSFFGRPFSEAKLLGYAYAYEQRTHLRTPPRFLPTAAQ
jgi:amidase